MKYFNSLSTWLIAAGLVFTACSKNEPAKQVKSNGLPKAAASQTTAEAVAIVDIDTLASQYEYCKQEIQKLETKQRSYQQQLTAKGQALQNAMVAFQNKLQNGKFTSQQEAEAAQAKLQKQQQALQSFQMKIEEDMAKATQKYQEVLRDSINNFMQDFNKGGQYKVILSKSGDNVLYADPAVDITDQVVEGLNKRFKK